MKEMTSQLESKNVKPSIARIKVLEYLTQYPTHPTVDEIYHHLADEIPTLSKTTVYNSLKVFKEIDLVREINLGEHQNRYDVDVSEHGHFKCDHCGRIIDLSINLQNVDAKELEGCRIDHRHVYFRGFCSLCSASKQ